MSAGDEGRRLHRRLGRHRWGTGDARDPARRLARERVAALTSAQPAERFELPKGQLEPGADADLVLVNLRDRQVPELRDRHKLSPFAGRPLPRIVRAWVRGGAARGRLVTPRKDTA